jgi:hypothetical protein
MVVISQLGIVIIWYCSHERDGRGDEETTMSETETYMTARILNRDPAELLLKLKGEQYAEYRMQWEQASEMKVSTRFPTHIDVDIIDSCNKYCSMCVQWKNPGFSGNKMSFEMFRCILNEMKEHDGKSINIGTNAEPLFDLDFFRKMLMILKEYDVLDSFVHTNGLNFNYETRDTIIDTGITNMVFSFGLLENRKQDYLTLQNIRLLKERMGERNSELPIIRVMIIPSGTNQMELQHILSAVSPVADYVGFQYFFDGKADVNFVHMKKKRVVCSDPWRRLYVDTTGRMFQCCNFTSLSSHLFLGNISEVSVFDAWNGDQAIRDRMGIKYRGISECNRCMDGFYVYDDKDKM